MPHEILVKLKEDSIGDIIQSKGLIRNIIDLVQGKVRTYLNKEINTFDWDPADFTNRSFLGDPYLLHIRVPEEIDLDYAISYLKSSPYVEYVEKNGITYISTNDTYFDQQWGLLNLEYSGRDIHAQDAWSISTGSSEIIVAVLDTGIDYNHEDLQGNLWTNPNEILDGQDNDGNTLVDDLHGWNFISGEANYLDDNNLRKDYDLEQCVPAEVYHGIHVSGIIGAVGNNGTGISGVCWNVKIMPLKTADSCGGAPFSALINALDYATNTGAFLSSNSYAGNQENLSFKAAIARAQAKSRLFIAAAGNYPTGIDLDSSKRYPVCYEYDNIVGVLATANNDYKCGFSNYGKNSVDVGAPGDNILSIKLGNAYQLHAGTSMATPFVAGAAALALGICPGLTDDRLKNLIIDGADDVSDLSNKCIAEGRLNAYNVLNALGGTTPPTPPSNLTAYPISWTHIRVQWNDNSNNEVGFEIQNKDQYQSVFLHDNCADANSTSIVSFQDSIDVTKQRTYTYRVRATNRAGISSFTNTSSASIPYTVPESPTDLEGQSPTLEQNVHIYWVNHAVNALHTYLERRIPGATGWQIIATLSYNADSYSDNSAQSGHIYEYRVRAGNPLGYSSYSNVVAIEVIEW